MSAEKHPVSYLQELMAKQKKALPDYKTSSSSSGYICSVTVDGITATSTAASTKAAKLQAASKAAAILKAQQKTHLHRQQSTASSSNSSYSEDLISFVDTPSPAVGKHPISELQEIMAKEKRPDPEYVIKELFTGNYPSFQCTLTVDGKSFVSETPQSTKQLAKKEVAEKALKYVKLCSLRKPMNTSYLHTKELINYNAVSVLNEYLQKNGPTTPTYQAMGANSNGEFIVLCAAAGKEAEGCHFNKKAAKQEAAHNMIKLLNINVQTYLPPLNTKPVKLRNDEEVIKKYAEITSNGIESLIESQKNLSLLETPNEDTSETMSDLIKYLDNFNIPYNCGLVQQKPPVVYLNLEDSLPVTVLGTGETYKEAYLDVLKKACKLKMPAAIL